MTRTMTKTLTGLFLCASLVACKGGEDKGGEGKPAPVAKKSEPKKVEKEAEPEAPPLDPRVAKAAKLADEIEAAPQKADEILDENGLDRDKLDELMYEIAADEKLAAEYKLARAESKAPAAP